MKHGDDADYVQAMISLKEILKKINMFLLYIQSVCSANWLEASQMLG